VRGEHGILDNRIRGDKHFPLANRGAGPVFPAGPGRGTEGLATLGRGCPARRAPGFGTRPIEKGLPDSMELAKSPVLTGTVWA